MTSPIVWYHTPPRRPVKVNVYTKISLAYADNELNEYNEDDEQDEQDVPESEPEYQSDSELNDNNSSAATPAQGPEAKTLQVAIFAAPLTRVQGLLNFICQQDAFARELMSRHLLTPVVRGSRPKRKRFADEDLLCELCGEYYEEKFNDWESCVYHSGESIKRHRATTVTNRDLRVADRRQRS